MSWFKRILNGSLIVRTNKEIIHPYWDVAESQDLAKQPGKLLNAFSDVALNDDVNRSLEVLASVNTPDSIDNVFTHAAHENPSA